MNNAIETMLSRYDPHNNLERNNAIKEIIQEIALAGLYRGGFFDKAAFYGGTCLRIFHGLDRFSEDLDFALLHKDSSFRLEDYYPALEKEFASYGIDVVVESKGKDRDAEIQSAFLKGNTLSLMMSFFPRSEEAKRVVPNQKTKIKFEIDIDNPEGGTTEHRYRLLPAPYEVQVFDEPTLFSGKIHAILCRQYQHHVKGRDYYDYLFYIGRGTKTNLRYLENKLKNSNKLAMDGHLSIDGLREMLRERFATVDYDSAKNDVANFIDNKESLSLWGEPLFISTLGQLEVI